FHTILTDGGVIICEFHMILTDGGVRCSYALSRLMNAVFTTIKVKNGLEYVLLTPNFISLL
ncbi:hypothetical protein L9F63_021489, partial [Diploptera punctata]